MHNAAGNAALMQRISGLAACRELGGLAARSYRAWPRDRGSNSGLPAVQWAGVRVFTGAAAAPGRRLGRLRGRRFVFAGQTHRLFSTEPSGEPGSSAGHRGISVVGIPDPITWIRCKVIMYLIELYFELGITSVEFDNGVKQALVHVSNKMSRGKFEELRGLVSNEMVNYVEKKCKSLTDAQRQQLAISMDDIIFLLPEDVSVFFDQNGRKFCFVVMRFWLLSTLEGPDDPEGSKIFKVTSDEDGGPRRKIVTAVYEFHRELTTGAPPDWTVTNVWHWHWKLAE
ncbi:m-AAA protease-interacting protein 1, mitochondrial [Myripristis murdjan]|uniref:Si:dkey-82o10.4 n=1 Tax=Myripristis murdjan TaxID=586833 RepID=A0A667XKZ5_9TELE|nr:m-AAA protease-interacting protein 1, mitochondrial-like [Myripristis murdjan]